MKLLTIAITLTYLEQPGELSESRKGVVGLPTHWALPANAYRTPKWNNAIDS
jgi:hypothetical protein